VNRNDDVDVLAGAAARARQDLNAVTSLRPVPVPVLASQSRRDGRVRAGGWRRRFRSPALAGLAVAVLVLGTLVGIKILSDGDGGGASPRPSSLLRRGAEVDGMRLRPAGVGYTEIFGVYCDPIVLQPGTYTRTCGDVARWHGPLLIGHGTLADSPKDLEQIWQAQRWELYLDGRPVNLAAFGTLPDRHYFEPALGREVWVRQWAVTIANPTPGPHTIRSVVEQSPAGDIPVGTYDTTWTLTVN